MVLVHPPTPPGITQHDMKTNRIKKFKIDSMTGLPFAVIDHEVHDPQYDVEGAVEDTEKVEEAHEVSMLVGVVCVCGLGGSHTTLYMGSGTPAHVTWSSTYRGCWRLAGTGRRRFI